MKLLVLIGPPAVGKMTVGQALEARLGYKLFHNHVSIDMVAPYFSYATEEGRGLVQKLGRCFLLLLQRMLTAGMFSPLCARSMIRKIKPTSPHWRASFRLRGMRCIGSSWRRRFRPAWRATSRKTGWRISRPRETWCGPRMICESPRWRIG